MIILLALISLILGLVFSNGSTILFAISMGFVMAQLFIDRKMIERLKQQINSLQKSSAKNEPFESEQTIQHADTNLANPSPIINEGLKDSATTTASNKEQAPVDDAQESGIKIPDENMHTSNNDFKNTELESENKILKWLKEYSTRGNITVKVGVTILFFGIAFLIKLAAERNILPIELRLAGIALIGLALLFLGWRLRESKTAYALILQGGALAILYLCVFSALRLYDLIPLSFAFGLLFVFAAFSAILAVIQNARSLAVLAISGGFLAPILTSSGSDNHIALFSYYLLLNLSIFSIAWFRSWRLLNLMGFVFTFVIASVWGYQLYVTEHFISSELFLIAFYLLYVAISVLFAFKQAIVLKGYVDSTLVFGVPIIGFSLQAGMVGDSAFGLAMSSLALSGFYIALAAFLWARMNPHSRLLCEAFLALGIIFATLSIPFALDAQWTASTWVLEGVAAFWIGCRQSRLLPRVLGYLLQFAGAVAFIYAQNLAHSGHTFLINSSYLGTLVIALSGLFIAFKLDTFKLDKRDVLKQRFSLNLNSSNKSIEFDEKTLSSIFFIWGLIWWYTPGFLETQYHFADASEPLVYILLASFTALFANYLKHYLKWDKLSYPALGLLVCLLLIFPATLISSHPQFSSVLLLAWYVSFSAFYRILKHYASHPSIDIGLIHTVTFWLISLVLISEAFWLIKTFLIDSMHWTFIAMLATATLIMRSMYLYGHKLAWPIKKFQQSYQLNGLQPFAYLLVFGFIFLALYSDGQAKPLAYIPILNPLELLLTFILFTLYEWQYRPLSFENWAQDTRYSFSLKLMGFMTFLLINTIWLRTAHHYWGIAYNFSDLIGSQVVQLGLSLVWSLSGIAFMLLGGKKKNRNIWIIGAAVMVAVVLKLLLFDLAHSGSIERIASFMSVGALLLLVGYFAPVPPVKSAESEPLDHQAKMQHDDV